MLAPTATPPEIVERLAAVLLEALRAPAFREQLRSLGFEVIGNGPDIPWRIPGEQAENCQIIAT